MMNLTSQLGNNGHLNIACCYETFYNTNEKGAVS